MGTMTMGGGGVLPLPPHIFSFSPPSGVGSLDFKKKSTPSFLPPPPPSLSDKMSIKMSVKMSMKKPIDMSMKMSIEM